MIMFQMEEIVLKGAAPPAPKQEDKAAEPKKDDKKKDAPAPKKEEKKKPAPKPLEPLSKYLMTREGDLFWNIVVFYLILEAAVWLYTLLAINLKLQQENDVAEDNIGEWLLNMESVPRMQKKFKKLQE